MRYREGTVGGPGCQLLIFWFLSKVGESGQQIYWLPSYVMTESLKEGNRWQWVIQHIQDKQKQEGEKSSFHEGLSSSPRIWLCGCLTTQNLCELKGVAVILRRPPMPAATTTHCYSTEDQDFTFQATGLPVGDCLGQAGHVGTDKALSTLTSVGLPSCNGKYNQSPCACPTPSIPVQVTFGYWQFPISLLLIPKDLAGYIVPMFSSFSLLLCPNYKTVDELQACGGEWCSLEWWHHYFLRRNEWDQGKINLFFQLGFLQSMDKGIPLLVQWLEEPSKN